MYRGLGALAFKFLRADAAKPISAQDALYAAIKDGHFFWTISPRRSPNIKRSLSEYGKSVPLRGQQLVGLIDDQPMGTGSLDASG